jgi:hypothetical protein
MVDRNSYSYNIQERKGDGRVTPTKTAAMSMIAFSCRQQRDGASGNAMPKIDCDYHQHHNNNTNVTKDWRQQQQQEEGTDLRRRRIKRQVGKKSSTLRIKTNSMDSVLERMNIITASAQCCRCEQNRHDFLIYIIDDAMAMSRSCSNDPATTTELASVEEML